MHWAYFGQIQQPKENYHPWVKVFLKKF
jgi:hypothetical protein